MDSYAYGEQSSYTKNIKSYDHDLSLHSYVLGYQKAMSSLIEAEKELKYNTDPESKRRLAKIQLQKKLNKKHWKIFLQSCQK